MSPAALKQYGKSWIVT